MNALGPETLSLEGLEARYMTPEEGNVMSLDTVMLLSRVDEVGFFCY